MSSDTSSIFAELSAESRSMKAVNLENLFRMKSKGKKKKKQKDVKKELGLDALSINLPTDEPSVTPLVEREEDRNEATFVEDIMDMCRAGSKGGDLEVVLAAGGDSDDDDSSDEDGGEVRSGEGRKTEVRCCTYTSLFCGSLRSPRC